MWLEYLRSMSIKLEWDFWMSNTVCIWVFYPSFCTGFYSLLVGMCLTRLLGFDMVWWDIQRNGVWEVMAAQTFFSSEFATGLIVFWMFYLYSLKWLCQHPFASSSCTNCLSCLFPMKKLYCPLCIISSDVAHLFSFCSFLSLGNIHGYWRLCMVF